MNNNLKKIGFWVVAFIFFSPNVWAQNYGDFLLLKKKALKLLERNKQLTTQYFSLHESFSKLKNKEQQEIQAIEKVKKELDVLEGLRSDVKDFIETMQKNIKGHKDDILVKESWVAYLKGELADAETSQKLKELQLKDLEYQKQKLQMDLELRKMDKKKDQKVDVKDLQRILQDNQKKEKSVLENIEKIEGKIREYAQEIRQVKSQKENFLFQIKSLEKTKDLEKSEKANLEDKKKLITRKLENRFLEKKSEKDSLKKRVDVQEQEYANLDQTFHESLKKQEQERVLAQEMVELDKQNVKLKKRIAELETLVRELDDDQFFEKK